MSVCLSSFKNYVSRLGVEWVEGEGGYLPSERCLSSKILNAPKEAAPARASWPKLDSFASPFWTWL